MERKRGRESEKAKANKIMRTHAWNLKIQLLIRFSFLSPLAVVPWFILTFCQWLTCSSRTLYAKICNLYDVLSDMGETRAPIYNRYIFQSMKISCVRIVHEWVDLFSLFEMILWNQPLAYSLGSSLVYNSSKHFQLVRKNNNSNTKIYHIWSISIYR